jgi:hypothetical protein
VFAIQSGMCCQIVSATGFDFAGGDGGSPAPAGLISKVPGEVSLEGECPPGRELRKGGTGTGSALVARRVGKDRMRRS